LKGPYFLDVNNKAQLKNIFNKIGCDKVGTELMLRKSEIVPLLFKAVKSPGANVIKQQMLSLGGEAVVGRGVIDCSQEDSDVLLLGTLKEYQYLVEKLYHQPWGLAKVGEGIKELFMNNNRWETSMKKSCRWKWSDRQLVVGDKVQVMGILNVTPDSFSDGGRYINPQKALEHARKMVEEGADIIDVGGESTRPGSSIVSAEEELDRVMPVLEILLKELPVPISLDTYKATVAQEALSLGVNIINDVGGGQKDPGMAEVVARFNSPVIIMHNVENSSYDDLIPDIIDWLENSIQKYEDAGLSSDKIVIDPGIGFGKTPEENLTVIKRIKSFQALKKPLLLGASRKSFIGKVLDIPVGERLEGSLAAVAWGVMKDVEMVRVHDVKETVKLIKVLEAIKKAGDSV